MRKKVTDKLHKKRSSVKHQQRVALPQKPLLTESGDSYEERLDSGLQMEERKKEKKNCRKKTAATAVRVLLVILSIYLVFLIYGVINTQYAYDTNGNVIPLVMSYNQIMQLNNFNKLAVQYRQARLLYEQVLVLDYRIAAALEDPLVVAPEYEKILTSVEPLAIQLSAITVPAEYTQTKNMLLTWTKNDIAIYCQNMSKSISQNNEEYANNALEYKSLMYQDFSVITQNLISLGMRVDGTDLTDIMAWSPEKYVQDTLGTYEGE
ncbi:MAG: hypothetical protein LBI03_09535 [Clostridiales bacterium]|jgi:hypothetical protein|nr:hypothetical protein [Clostridiales bacterium]